MSLKRQKHSGQTLDIVLDLKALQDGQFEGHGSTFGNVDLGGDIMARGAFKRSLREHKRAGTMPAMLWMHDPAQVIGKWDDMREDDDGLKVRGTLAPTQLGAEVGSLLKMEAVRGLSVGYRTVDAEWRDDGIRVIKEVDLWEVSVVTFAMNPLAKVEAVKSRLSASGEYVPSVREMESILRDVGCSKQVARTLCAKMFPGGMPGDVDEDDPGRWDAGEGEGLKHLLDNLARSMKP